MLIRTVVFLTITGLIKYLASKYLTDVLIESLEEAQESKERARRNAETTQSNESYPPPDQSSAPHTRG